MKVQFISDLHLEFSEHRQFYKEYPLKPLGDILCIAGDLGYLNFRRKNHIYEKYCDSFLEYCSKNYKETFIVPGNHEYYGGFNLDKFYGIKQLYPNVYLLNNGSKLLKYDDTTIKLLGATFWTNIDPEYKGFINAGMNDYNYIQYHKRPFTTDLCSNEHDKSVSYFIDELSKKDYDKSIIVTHHAPHEKSLNDNYNHYSTLNSAYYTDMSNFLKNYKPNIWIHGHTHACKDYKIHNTHIVANSMGYLHDTEEIINLNWASSTIEI